MSGSESPVTVVKVPFSGCSISLAFDRGFPFVPIAPVCSALGIDLTGQLCRIRRRIERSALPAISIPGEGWSVPLEDLSWFLRTLRPNLANQQALQNFRDNLPRFLITAVVELQGRYLVPRADREFRYSLPNVYGARVFDRPPKRTGRYTTADAQSMKALRQEGYSLSQIAQRYRCSPTAVSLITNDKYALHLQPESSETPENARETLGEGVLNSQLGVETLGEG